MPKALGPRLQLSHKQSTCSSLNIRKKHWQLIQLNPLPLVPKSWDITKPQLRIPIKSSNKNGWWGRGQGDAGMQYHLISHEGCESCNIMQCLLHHLKFFVQKGRVIYFPFLDSSPNLQEFKAIWIQVLSGFTPDHKDHSSGEGVDMSVSLNPHFTNIDQIVLTRSSARSLIAMPNPNWATFKTLMTFHYDRFMTGSWLNGLWNNAYLIGHPLQITRGSPWSQSWKVTSSFSCEISAQSCFTLPGYLDLAAGPMEGSVKILKLGQMQGNLDEWWVSRPQILRFLCRLITDPDTAT